MKLFDAIKCLTSSKCEFTPEDVKEYNVFVTNMAFGMDKSTVFVANEVNKPEITSQMSIDFYKNFLPKQSIYLKWVKNKKSDDEIEIICDYYKCNKEVAIQYLDILSKEDFQWIKSKLITGGLQKKNKKGKK